jgi:hypothetical protein
MQRRDSGSITVASGSESEFWAQCNADETVVGGGYEVNGAGVEQLKGLPDSATRRFSVKVKNNNNGQGGNRSAKAYAICMKVTNG